MAKELRMIWVLLLIAAALAGGASGEKIFDTMYWLDGQVLPPASDPTVSVDNRIVVFYLKDPSQGYALDVSGTAGSGGRSGEFMINTMEDWRLDVNPGTYKVGIVKGSDNYGMDPIDVTISGKGCDTTPPLRLAYGAGIEMTKLRSLPGWLAVELPSIKLIQFDDRLYQKKLVEGASKLIFLVGPQPKVTVKVVAGNVGIDKNKLAVVVDEGTAGAKTYTYSQFGEYSEVMGLAAPREINFSVNLKVIGDTLAESDHQFTFYAGNDIGSTFETASVKVMSGLQVVGTPITSPSPVQLSKDNSVLLQYGLTSSANIDIYVFDITGNVVKKLSFNSGEMGGHVAGTANPNKVQWDMVTDQGQKLGVGTYLWHIVDRDKSRVIGKGKLPAYP
jgi:hypothetical protein